MLFATAATSFIVNPAFELKLGLLVPEIVLMELDPVLGRSEPDFEIQSLLKASAGLNRLYATQGRASANTMAGFVEHLFAADAALKLIARR